MARKIFIAATGQHCGKTVTSLALLHLGRQKYKRIGFMKPFGARPVSARGMFVDKDAALMAEVFGLRRQLPWMSPVVIYPDTTHRMVDGEISTDALIDRIMSSCAEIEKRCDFMVIEGSGHPGVGSVMKLSNARIASLLNVPVMLLAGGGLGKVVDEVQMGLALFRQEQVQVRALLVNKIIPEKRERMMDYLRRALAEEPFGVLSGFDWEPVLSNPTLRRISWLLELPLVGNQREAGRIIHHVQVAAAPPQRVAELLKEGSLLVVTSNRDELLVTLSHLYMMPEYRRRIVGLIIPGIIPVNAVTQRILDRSRIPYMRTQRHTTAELLRIIHDDVSKITAEDKEKLELVRDLAGRTLDLDAIESICDAVPQGPYPHRRSLSHSSLQERGSSRINAPGSP
ncbi:phosphotransacetylase family protein [Geobacter sp. DSM 9736]|uniref:phosphotransacetylase family protein n=1 Tax=Geobacter sp. DSM 9736 TaxID=1277350 RepID=UPI000B50B239|nr:AAA family ATPase [Geobacter sp. DSM 9736]SNB45252.1 hypothetical protein SAMN06269301_0656 [Geobacter sp. DSM 9736]